MSECSHDDTVDLDLHRFRCLECGEVLYYSIKAREHFTGVKLDAGIQESNERYLARLERGSK
jgi:hypothetical protein